MDFAASAFIDKLSIIAGVASSTFTVDKFVTTASFAINFGYKLG